MNGGEPTAADLAEIEAADEDLSSIGDYVESDPEMDPDEDLDELDFENDFPDGF